MRVQKLMGLLWLLMLQMKEMNARTESTQPNSCMSDSDDQHVHCATIKMESYSPARKGSKEKISTRDISLLAGTWGLHSVFFQAIQCEICCLFLYPIGALYELINQKLVYYIIPKYLFTKSMILFVSLSRIKVTEEIDYLLGCRCTSIASFLSYHISS